MSAGEPVSAATVLSIVRDLTALTPDATRAETVRAGLEIAQHATSSHIAYLHFLNDDQNTIELGAWSQETMSYCTAVYDRHYPITQAGIWADSARLRKPCVYNDYEHMTDRRGLPDGHSRLVRHMGVPVVDEGAVRMLVGVGNKDSDYTETDLALLEDRGSQNLVGPETAGALRRVHGPAHTVSRHQAGGERVQLQL